MIEEIFSFVEKKETDGDFQARAIVILAPKRIKCNKLWVDFDMLGIL